MTQEQIDSIRERMCDNFCWFTRITWDKINAICETCPLNELEVSAEPGWIPVTERLPEDTGKYLVTVRNGNVYAGTYDKYSRTFQCAATAWMPLPEPYEEAGE